MIRNILSLLLLFQISLLSVNAQFSIQGIITDASNIPIPFVNLVLLTESDSIYLKGDISDESGAFHWTNIPIGSYELTLSYIGYDSKVVPLQLTKDFHLGTITLQEKVNNLNEITVRAKRKIISKKIDRLVFDVANSMNASQGDALDVLQNTPGISVRNETIRMMGKRGVSVMIDNKMIRLTDEELATFLRSISSEDIATIEVITAPPAKYDAEGNSGIIHILLKKAKVDSWNVALRSDYRQRTNSRYANGIGFNYRKNKWSIASSLYHQGGIYRQTQLDDTYFSDGLWYTDSSFDRAFSEGSGRLDIGYTISDDWTIGGQYFYSFSDQNPRETPTTIVTDYTSGKILQTLNTNGNIDQLRHIHSINLYNQFNLDSLGKKITFNVDYFNLDDWEDKRYDGIYTNTQPVQKQYYAGMNINNQLIVNSSATIDIELPNPIINLEFGAKYTNSKSTNDTKLFNSGLVQDPIDQIPLADNDLEYSEQIQAAYISLQKKINKQWEAKLGFRWEGTQTSSLSNNLNFDRQNDYQKIFPTFYLSHTLKENQTFNFSYNKRISRAPFYMLNPNPWFANPFQWVVGNPFLQPSFSDNFELSWIHKNLSVSTYYNLSEQVFTQVPIPNASNNSMEFKFENFLDSKQMGMNINHLFEKIHWWSSSNRIDVNYTLNDYYDEGKTVTKKGYATSFSTSNDFSLNTAKTISLNISYWYQPPGLDEIWDLEAMSNLSFALQFSLLNKRLQLTLRGNDLLKTQKERTSAIVAGVRQEVNMYYDSRYIGLVASYNFGNTTISTKKNKVGNQAERNRAGRF